MQISSRFTIAIHLLTCIAFFKDKKMTSDFLALSINVNPVTIRRILKQLQVANIITVARGNTGNIKLNKTPQDISFYDIYNAIDNTNQNLFNFHKNPNLDCPIGKNIHKLLDNKLLKIQNTLHQCMQNTTLKKVFDEAKEIIK